MRSCHARLRALLALLVALLALLPLGTQAAADDPTPRAVPAARSYPRSFATYDALTAYAAGISAAQTALDATLATMRAQGEATRASLGELRPSVRGGALFEIDAPQRTASEVARLHRDIASFERTAAQLAAAGALASPATAWRMPTAGRITQSFGPTTLWVEPSRTYEGITYAHFHEGVDIAGAWAAPVVAPERGRVVFVGRMPDGAEVVVLAHDDGLVSLYAHLDAYASPPPVAAGDEVAAGERIGTVGLTGITTGEHLHWAVWRDGTLIDPLTLVGQ